LKIKLIAIDSGIELLIQQLKAKVEYDKVVYDVDFESSDTLEAIDRQFTTEYDPLAPDDIKMIDTKNSTIDLKEIIREEILLQIMQY